MPQAPDIFYHRYGLKLRDAAGGNARSGRRVLEGFLIRVGRGVACVQPWPELGDGTLEEQWQALREGRNTPLLERARVCAAADAEARREGRSLFEGLAVPRSHCTITGEADFEALRAEGFDTVKLKGGKNWREVLEKLRQAAAAGLRVRVDFNGVLEEREFLDFVKAAGGLGETVDFVEDPVPYEAELWQRLQQQTGWRLALDRVSGTISGGFGVRVLKPALEGLPGQAGPVVITSYMDHPVGQAFAAWEAARFAGPQERAGLLTHRLFEPDAFSERLAGHGPDWIAPAGSGLGFDDLLEALPWVSLRGPDRKQAGRVLQNPRDPLPDGGPVLEAGQVGFATSGSTGRPAVVVHTQESLEASAAAVNAWLDTRAEDVWLRVLPDFHVGGFQIHTRASLAGSRVVVDEGKWDVDRFVRLGRSEGITLTSLVPAQVVDLVRGGGRGHPGLRAIVVGGGALEDRWIKAAWELGWPVLPSYGASETASQVATARLPSLPAAAPGPMEILPLWEARVEKEDGSPAAPGDAGLLALRGAALAAGRFVRMDGGWQFSRLADAGGWWRTADRVILSGRELTFAGRMDRVVKVLGELVNLEAVERDLVAAGLDAGRFAVIALPEERRGADLVLAMEGSMESAEGALKVYAGQAAPFARITRIVRLESLPRSPLGKIRYAGLAALILGAAP
ncbi:MAG: AMP-binding protein [Verrucomicrobiota bacterium]